MRNTVPFCLGGLFLVFATTTIQGGEIEIRKVWSTSPKEMFPTAGLKLLPKNLQNDRIGYIGSPATFEKVWKAFKPGQPTPRVDFKDDMVLYVRNIKYVNFIGKVTITANDGRVSLKCFETKTAFPIKDKLHMVMVVVPRKGLRSLNSNGKVIMIPPR